MSLNEWIQLKPGDKVTRDQGKTVWTVEEVARAVGTKMAVKIAGCLQTEHKEWERVKE